MFQKEFTTEPNIIITISRIEYFPSNQKEDFDLVQNKAVTKTQA